MADESKELLEKELSRVLDCLSGLDPESEEYKDVAENLVKLYKLKIDEVKTLLDHEEKCNRRELDEKQNDRDAELKEKQIDNDALFKERQIDNDVIASDREEQLKRDQIVEQTKDRYFKYGVEVGLALLTLMFYRSYMKKGFKFEETGTIASPTFRNLISNFKFKFGLR